MYYRCTLKTLLPFPLIFTISHRFPPTFYYLATLSLKTRYFLFFSSFGMHLSYHFVGCHATCINSFLISVFWILFIDHIMHDLKNTCGKNILSSAKTSGNNITTFFKVALSDNLLSVLIKIIKFFFTYYFLYLV